VGQLKRLASTLSKLLLFLDGFDEMFPEESREPFLLRLKSLMEGTPTRLMIFSRPLPTISKMLAPSLVFRVIANTRDIRSHVETEIMNNTAFYNVVTSPPSMLDAVLDTIQRRSENM
jgi:hypothetical protein